MKIKEARELIRSAEASGEHRNLPAVAFELEFVGRHPDGSVDLTGDAFIKPVPHPLVEAYMMIRGATRHGRMGWRVGLGEHGTTAPLSFLLHQIAPGLVWHKGSTHTTKAPRDMNTMPGYHRGQVLSNAFIGTDAFHLFGRGRYGNVTDPELNAALSADWPRDGLRFGGVGISQANNVAHVSLFTHIPLRALPEDLPQIQLNLHPAGKTASNPKPVQASHAIELAAWLRAEGATVICADGEMEKAWDLMQRSVVASPTPGQPAIASVSVGPAARLFLPRLVGEQGPSAAGMTTVTVPSTILSEALAAAPVVEQHLHPGVRDIVEMARAPRYEDDSLYSYQRDAVGVHLSTSLGYLNSCSPGMGKTIQALVGMRERARSVTGYRGLIVVEANVRTQWSGEAAKWFPTARLFTVTKRDDVDKLDAAIAEAGDEPLLIIMSYAMLKSVYEYQALLDAEDVDVVDARDEEAAAAAPVAAVIPPVVEKTAVTADDFALDGEQFALFTADLEIVAELIEVAVAAEPEPEVPAHLGRTLLSMHFHDLVADEAEVLRSTGSKQASALWTLRYNSDVALALTGTPINKGLDDLGRLLAWVRKDARMFYGVKLSETFDIYTTEGLKEFADAMGPVLFRRDTSEVSDDMPSVKQVEMRLKPSPAEKALADAATRELRRLYEELSAAIEAAELLDPENPAFEQARDALQQARGALLGGSTLARMAASDPASLLSSTSAAATLLAGQGLIEAATQVAGTKRTAVMADVIRRVGEGEAVLVFTEFATVASGLFADLEAAGIRTGKVVGGSIAARDRNVAAFQAGELDVLVATASGERGLNLQRANTIYHYDLPWTPKGVIQRTGRARRLKSENKSITVVFPIMEDTIEERVAAKVVTRAIESMRALDTARGVDASVTEMGLALGGLAQSMTNTREGRRHGSDIMEITRELVGAVAPSAA